MAGVTAGHAGDSGAGMSSPMPGAWSKFAAKLAGDLADRRQPT